MSKAIVMHLLGSKSDLFQYLPYPIIIVQSWVFVVGQMGEITSVFQRFSNQRATTCFGEYSLFTVGNNTSSGDTELIKQFEIIPLPP